jgi:prepilin-type N-terminal cleavage/methylation domain-containing protein
MDRGFTLVELLIVVFLGFVLATMAVPIVGSSLNYYRADSAMDTTMTQLRLARSMAVDQRRVFSVAFSGTGTITLSRVDDDGLTEISSMNIHRSVSFAIGSGVTAGGDGAPDGLSADGAIDFMDGSEVRFRPDGSAVTAGGDFCNGVVHMSVDSDSTVARAVTVFGATGKIKGWRWITSGSEEGQWK